MMPLVITDVRLTPGISSQELYDDKDGSPLKHERNAHFKKAIYAHLTSFGISKSVIAKWNTLQPGGSASGTIIPKMDQNNDGQIQRSSIEKYVDASMEYLPKNHNLKRGPRKSETCWWVGDGWYKTRTYSLLFDGRPLQLSDKKVASDKDVIARYLVLNSSANLNATEEARLRNLGYELRVSWHQAISKEESLFIESLPE